jgi:hypothetical protein
MRKQNERLASVVQESDKDKLILSLKQRINGYEKAIENYKTRKRYSDSITCKQCGETKEKSRFKILDLGLNLGICNQCAKSDNIQTRRMKETELASQKATDLMAEALRNVERIFTRHKLPLETNLIGSIVKGAIDIVSYLQTSVRIVSNDITPIAEVNNMINRDIIWPIIMYTLSIAQGNQVTAAKILGISRNTLRDRMKQVEINCPRLIDEFRCREKWPTKIKERTIGYLEMDPEMEARNEEVVSDVRVIDSGIKF